MKQWKTAKLKKLAKAFLSIKDEKHMLSFLKDLCTLEELEDLSTRWHIVGLLSEGKTYRVIAEKVGVSTTTVTRIAQSLNQGEGGYQRAIELSHQNHPQ